MLTEANGQLIPVGGGDPIPLIRDTLTIGRRESNDICLRFPNVSGQHCVLTFHNGYWYIRDLGSTNGIKVNNERVHKKVLRPKDEIKIAKRRFTIDYQLQAGRHAMEELLDGEQDDVMGQSLLEKAGLSRPRRDDSMNFDPAEFLRDDDEDDEER